MRSPSLACVSLPRTFSHCLADKHTETGTSRQTEAAESERTSDREASERAHGVRRSFSSFLPASHAISCSLSLSHSHSDPRIKQEAAAGIEGPDSRSEPIRHSLILYTASAAVAGAASAAAAAVDMTATRSWMPLSRSGPDLRPASRRLLRHSSLSLPSSLFGN